MKPFETITDILDFAIEQEQEAVEFYTRLSEQATTRDMKKIFLEFVQEEISHKAKLTQVKTEGLQLFETSKPMDLKLADYLIPAPQGKELKYEDALILAMKKEKAAFRLYSNLSERSENKELKELFAMLALEESKHKLKFELEYDDHFLKEN